MPLSSIFVGREQASGTRPVELITFALGSGSQARLWRYATSDVDVTFDGQVYRASAITRSATRQTAETGKTVTEFFMPRTTPIIVDWLANTAGGLPIGLTYDASGPRTTVMVLRVHVDADGVPIGTESQPVFGGIFSGVDVEGAEASIACETLQTLFERPVPRIPIQRTCPWSLHDSRCMVKPEDFDALATVAGFGESEEAYRSGLQTVTVTVDLPSMPQIPNDEEVEGDDLTYWDGGTILWSEEIEGNTVSRRTSIHRADISDFPVLVLTVDTPLPVGLEENVVLLRPGDQKTWRVCRFRFDNARRFGGFPWLPERNPLREGMA